MIAAGLVARKARARGLTAQALGQDLPRAGLEGGDRVLPGRAARPTSRRSGFHLVGYGCTTCIGNSGPLPEPRSPRAVERRRPRRRRGALGQPQLRGPRQPARPRQLPGVAAARRRLRHRRHRRHRPRDRAPRHGPRRASPSSCATSGRARPRWQALIASCVTREQFVEQYADVFQGSEEWRAHPGAGRRALPLGPERRPTSRSRRSSSASRPEPAPIRPIAGARCLAMLGDSVTTDHISPAGSIKRGTPAGALPRGARRRAGGLQLLRRAARQRPRHDPRHLRQHPHPEPARPGHRGRLHDGLHPLPGPARAARRGELHLRRRGELPARRHPARRARRQGLRHGLVARLGGEGHVPARACAR